MKKVIITLTDYYLMDGNMERLPIREMNISRYFDSNVSEKRIEKIEHIKGRMYYVTFVDDGSFVHTSRRRKYSSDHIQIECTITLTDDYK